MFFHFVRKSFEISKLLQWTSFEKVGVDFPTTPRRQWNTAAKYILLPFLFPPCVSARCIRVSTRAYVKWCLLIVDTQSCRQPYSMSASGHHLCNTLPNDLWRAEMSYEYFKRQLWTCNLQSSRTTLRDLVINEPLNTFTYVLTYLFT